MPNHSAIRFRPDEFTGFLLNPHKGCATFQRFNGDPLFEGVRWSEEGPTEFPARLHEGVTPGYLPCTVAYCRWFWEVFEPEEGRYDWTAIEQALATAEERGQTLQVRLMPHGSAHQPTVPLWYRENYETVERSTHGGRDLCKCPIYDSPEYIDKWGSAISEFGARFDGHPWLESVDMSYIGPWGEGAGDCSDEAIETISGIYADAHPKTPLMCMIDGRQMTACARRGTGWRCDCFGDIRRHSLPDWPGVETWCHHFDCYPQQVCLSGAQDAWMVSPVTFESCWVPMAWFQRGADLDFILRQGLKFHGSVLMPKSTALPGQYIEPLMAFCNDLGYRFVLRQALLWNNVRPGEAFVPQIWIENVGVAPIYRPYVFVLRLSQGERAYEHRFSSDTCTWLPGDQVLEEEIRLPDDFQPGTAEVHAALVHPEDESRRVRFANEGVDGKGWLYLGTVQIV
jgi:hypothetical protein